MQKRVISLTEPQIAFLETEAAKLGITLADLVRRILDLYREGRVKEC